MVNESLYPIIQCDNLSIGFGSPLVPAFQFRALPGFFIALMGENGVGKSTFLKTLTGYLPPLQGTLQINGRLIHTLTATEKARLLSVVGTSRVQGFNLTCSDMVAMGRSLYTNWLHQLSETDQHIIEEAITNCKLQEHRGKLLENLSDGLYQKTMVAKALAQQTPILLLDEPSAFLDYPSKHELFRLLKTLCDNGKTVIISSHDLDMVKQYCSHIILMHNEKGFMDYTASHPDVVALFDNLARHGRF